LESGVLSFGRQICVVMSLLASHAIVVPPSKDAISRLRYQSFVSALGSGHNVRYECDVKFIFIHKIPCETHLGNQQILNSESKSKVRKLLGPNMHPRPGLSKKGLHVTLIYKGPLSSASVRRFITIT